MMKFESYQKLIENFNIDEEQNNIIDVDRIMSEIIVVLREGRENIIEKGGLIQIALEVAEGIFEKFEEVIKLELDAGRFIDELFRFYEAISFDQITEEFTDILIYISEDQPSSIKQLLKQQKYIIPLLHLMEMKQSYK
ncbi:MAG: hypothetical protein EZS28_026135 [Streblomastix strix]|uniref:Uncharacterized protein n=1 Tax=Streblomastix strix TaxID=222440 RepID=A0A5J4V6H8_9EUKA|nr:MAG: hypothetical protein EZS28_026135 [Streblomastix strix]